jgi:hypothetical protein
MAHGRGGNSSQAQARWQRERLLRLARAVAEVTREVEDGWRRVALQDPSSTASERMLEGEAMADARGGGHGGRLLRLWEPAHCRALFIERWRGVANHPKSDQSARSRPISSMPSKIGVDRGVANRPKSDLLPPRRALLSRRSCALQPAYEAQRWSLGSSMVGGRTQSKGEKRKDSQGVPSHVPCFCLLRLGDTRLAVRFPATGAGHGQTTSLSIRILVQIKRKHTRA